MVPDCTKKEAATLDMMLKKKKKKGSFLSVATKHPAWCISQSLQLPNRSFPGKAFISKSKLRPLNKRESGISLCTSKNVSTRLHYSQSILTIYSLWCYFYTYPLTGRESDLSWHWNAWHGRWQLFYVWDNPKLASSHSPLGKSKAGRRYWQHMWCLSEVDGAEMCR